MNMRPSGDDVEAPDAARRRQAQDILSGSLVWENHACMPLRADGRFLPELRRYRAARFDMVSLNIGFDATSLSENFSVIAHFRRWVREHAQDYCLIERIADVDAARRSGRTGIIFDLEGLSSVGSQIDLIDFYYDVGVRWAGITYSRGNAFGGGYLDAGAGLTDLGKNALKRMGQVGMVPCCSHANDRTALEILDHAEAPVIFSHSNARSVFEHMRNVPDHLIKACAAQGGVIGINGIGKFLGGQVPSYDTGIGALIRHIDHIVQLVGPEHISLGLDYVFDTEELADFYRSSPEMFSSPEGDTPSPMVAPESILDLVLEMIALGYGRGDIQNLLGKNVYRVCAATWR